MPFGKIAGKSTPLAISVQGRENAAQDIIQINLPRLGFFTSSFKQGLNPGKLFAADVSGVHGSHEILSSLRKNWSGKHQMNPYYKQNKEILNGF